jgi:hypothetical protein
MKNIKLFLAIIGLFIISTSCSSDSNPDTNRMAVSARGIYNTASSKTSNVSGIPFDIVLTSFRINVTELTLKYYDPTDDGDDDDGEGDNDNQGRDDGNNYHNVTVFGPWELDLLNQTINIASVDVPNGTYKKAELQLSKSLDPTSPIFNKTVEIRGMINGTPFVFWNDFDQRLLLKYDDDFDSVIIFNNSFEMVFGFDLNNLIDAIDISGAEDGDGDGVIEIGPNDTDGNNALAQLLDQHIGDCGGIEHSDHH